MAEGVVAMALVLVLECDRRARMKDSGADQATGMCKVWVDWFQTTHTHTHTRMSREYMCVSICGVGGSDRTRLTLTHTHTHTHAARTCTSKWIQNGHSPYPTSF